MDILHILGPGNESERELGTNIRAKQDGGTKPSLTMTSVQVSNVSSCDSGWTKTFLIWFIVVPDSFYKLLRILPMLVLRIK